MGEAVRGVVRVQRQVGRAGLEHREYGDHQVEGAGQGEGHEPLGPHSVPGEQPGQPVGAGVQLGVGEAVVAEGHGDRVGGAGGLGGEAGGQGVGGGPGGRVVAGPCGRAAGGVPLLDDPVDLLGSEYVDTSGGPGRVVGERLEDPHQPVADTVHRRGVEEVGTVVQAHGQPPLDHTGDDAQGVVGGVGGVQAGEGQAVYRRLEPGRFQGVVLEDRDGVEERAVSGDALHLGQPQVLMRHQVGLAGLESDQGVGERLGCGQLDADRQGVDEEPDHGLDARYLRWPS